MRAYEFAMYLAIVGCISGVLSGCGYMFPGYNTTQANNIIAHSTGGSATLVIQNYSSASSEQDQHMTLTDQTVSQLSVGAIVLRAILGILLNGIIILSMIPANLHTAEVVAFCYAITVGSWLVYGIGVMQYYSKVSLKYAH